jgi:hypothetical protein
VAFGNHDLYGKNDMDFEGVLERARAALGQRRSGEVLALSRTLVAAAPERVEGWLLQALALILDGQAGIVYRRVLPLRRRRFDDDGIVFLKDVFLILDRLKAYDAMLAAATDAPAGELFAIVPGYFAACVLLARRRFDEGFALLGAVRSRCLASLDRLPTTDDDGFMVLFRHALLVNDPGYLGQPYYRDNLALNRAQLGPLHWADAPEPEAPESSAPESSAPESGTAAERSVVMVSCDRRYADLFLPRFFESVDRLCRGRLVHLHLLDPEPEPGPGAAAVALPPLRHNRLALSWERSGALKCAAWYASARFVRMAGLLRHYRRPVVLFDVDVALCHPVELVEQAMADADFGCFRMDRLDPGSVYQASVTAFRPNPAGLELAELLGDLILSKMSLKRPLLWLIDQASLYSAVTILADLSGRLRVADLTRRLGMTVDQYVAFCQRNEDKLRLMKLASGLL